METCVVDRRKPVLLNEVDPELSWPHVSWVSHFLAVGAKDYHYVGPRIRLTWSADIKSSAWVQTSPTVWDISVGVYSTCLPLFVYNACCNTVIITCIAIIFIVIIVILPYHNIWYIFPCNRSKHGLNCMYCTTECGLGMREWTDRCASVIWTCCS